MQGLDELLKQLDSMSPEIDAARRAAVKSATKKADYLVKKRIAKKESISAKGVNQYRVKTKLFDYSGTIWLGHEPIKVRYAGKYEVIKGVGVRLGRRVFRGVFHAKMPSGHSGVFERHRKGKRWTHGRKRSSSPNLPIKETRIQFEYAEREIARISHEVERGFQRTLEFEIKKRIGD